MKRLFIPVVEEDMITYLQIYFSHHTTIETTKEQVKQAKNFAHFMWTAIPCTYMDTFFEEYEKLKKNTYDPPPSKKKQAHNNIAVRCNARLVDDDGECFCGKSEGHSADYGGQSPYVHSCDTKNCGTEWSERSLLPTAYCGDGYVERQIDTILGGSAFPFTLWRGKQYKTTCPTKNPEHEGIITPVETLLKYLRCPHLED